MRPNNYLLKLKRRSISSIRFFFNYFFRTSAREPRCKCP